MNHIGVDLVDIGRVESAVARWGNRFIHHVYTRSEIEACRGRAQSLAGRFAAKEAVMKALGCGFAGAPWLEIEILPDVDGKPTVRLYGRARSRAESLGIREVALSLSHSGGQAIAYVLAC